MEILYIPQKGNEHPWMTDFIEAVGDRATVVIYDDTGPIAEQFEGVDYVVELGGKVATHEMIDAAAAAGITFWQIQGTGMDHVDIPYFEKKGIQIANTPGQFSSIALAEHAIYFTRISDLELRLEHGTPCLLPNATTLPRKAGHDGIEGYSWPVLVVR